MVIAMAVTPFLIHLLGVSRWGVLSTALALVGMFGVFDFGIGRALTRLLAELVGLGEDEQAASLVKTGVMVLACVGLVVGALAFGFIYVWAHHVIRVPEDIRHQVTVSLYVLCLAIPLVVVTGALWGVISAYQQFRVVNLINMPIMAFYYIGPLIAVYFTNNLVWVMASLVACRVVMVVSYAIISLRTMPSLVQAKLDFSKIIPLLRIGGWMTVSNITFPFLQYCDRLVLISVLSAAAAGYYSTPADLVGRFFIVVGAVMASAFPAIASCYRRDPENAVMLFRRSILMVVLWLVGPCLIATAYSHLILSLWIGASYAAHAAPVFEILCLGVMLGGADQVVAGFLDSIGRPAVNAKFSTLEIFIYIPLMALLLHIYGIAGGAMAWSARAGVDFALRLWLACRLFPALKTCVPDVLKVLACATVGLAFPTLFHGDYMKLLAVAVAFAGIASFVWLTALSRREQQYTTMKMQKMLALVVR
jgi:O-antigen/teichoic acid export membrane protein